GNMAFALRAKRLPKPEIHRRVLHAADIPGLGGPLERKPGELSGGQRQRVAMGRAIVRDPAVFLFDEPLSNLDAKLRNQVRTEIKKLHQKVRTTVVYVTHDQVEAMTLADRIVILRDGRIEQVGTPMQVYADPVNIFVAGFIGNPAMNMIPAEIVGDGPTLRCVLAAGVAVPLAPRGGMALAPGMRVTFGIRPEDIAVLPAGAAAPAVVEANVALVEPLGAESLVSFGLGGHEVIAKTEGRVPPRAGAQLRFAFAMDNAHVFDAGTGRSLYPGNVAS
ncbi:MAG: TOBE domain-containing protein, partial [Proteobacteria bacterium]|nr:TOBE domain-containing protein [Pseudomonadota bacterium]